MSKSRNVLARREGGDGAGVGLTVVARLTGEEGIKVQVIRCEQHGVFPNLLDKEWDQLITRLTAEEYSATLDVFAGFG